MSHPIEVEGLLSPNEMKKAVRELFSNEKFVRGMKAFLPSDLNQLILDKYEDMNSCNEFQATLVKPFLHHVLATSSKGITSSGIELLDPKEKYLFISNHRDIGLDSAFVNLVLHDKGHETVQIAIGDNLMKHRMAELIFRVNKSFEVKRSGTKRELYAYANALSTYIHKVVTTKEDSVWIAQREGRAKDGNDATQSGVLKMIGLSGKEDLSAHFGSLKVVPVSITYEYDPCCFFKAKEYVDRLENPDYQKTFEADIASILQGFNGNKGHVHLSFGQPIQQASLRAESAKDFYARLTEIIDHQIIHQYQLYPINYIAHDLLDESHTYVEKYSKEAFEKAKKYFNKMIGRMEYRQDEARKYLLGIYANPLLNQSK